MSTCRSVMTNWFEEVKDILLIPSSQDQVIIGICSGVPFSGFSLLDFPSILKLSLNFVKIVIFE
jgi:hypothetical protein